MWNALSLALPVLIPSWRFFKAIEPSPRVQWALVADGHSTPDAWRDFRPKPLQIGPSQMLRGLFWNPDRNEALFVVSLAERIAQNPTPHSIDQIIRRIRQDLPAQPSAPFMRFRLVFVHRDAEKLVQEVLFTSDPVAIST